MKGIEGSLAVVTGAGSGIGLATALRLADAGARIVAVSERWDESSALADHAAVAAVVTADVSAPEQVDNLATTVAALGGADILVNNAGIWSESNFLERTASSFWPPMPLPT